MRKSGMKKETKQEEIKEIDDSEENEDMEEY
jgi:hypothetical protein